MITIIDSTPPDEEEIREGTEHHIALVRISPGFDLQEDHELRSERTGEVWRFFTYVHVTPKPKPEHWVIALYPPRPESRLEPQEILTTYKSTMTDAE